MPASAGMDQYRPNYAGDLAGMYYFEQPVITYRIMGAGIASAIDTSPIPSQDPDPVQAQDIRDAFAKIGIALGGRRQIVEVSASDASAAIDVVVQSEEDFGGQGEGGVPLGRSDLYYPGERRTTYIRRAVVRLMADQPERSFRRTALHECIHAMGLWGHSHHSGDILVPVSLPIIPVIKLSEYDVHTLQVDYARDNAGRSVDVANTDSSTDNEPCSASHTISTIGMTS